MEEIVCQVIGCLVELLIEAPELFRYRWFRYMFGLTTICLVGFAIYFYVGYC